MYIYNIVSNFEVSNTILDINRMVSVDIGSIADISDIT